MFPNKLVHSGILPLEHERAYARLLGKQEYTLHLEFPKVGQNVLKIPCIDWVATTKRFLRKQDLIYLSMVY